MTEIILKNIYKSYDQTEVIHGVDLKLESGKFLVLVGPSGCGKSTLLRIIAGLEKVTSGNILIDGEHVNNVPAAERGLAMVFQSYALYPHMSVYKNMAFGLENLKISKKIIDEKVRPAVARDGGDIAFKSFKDGIVTVELKGSCSGCPSSIMTLKQGVQNLLCHYVPEIKSVEAI